MIDEHFVLLKDVEAWNRWRGMHPEIRPDLSEADLRSANLKKANLSEADLSYADLSGADLNKADLRKANLRDADLSYADLSEASLRDADLSEADLREVKLGEAKLNKANLRGAYLTGVNLTGVDLTDADLTGARVGWTIFGACDLRSVKGLEKIEHRGPSTLGIDTIYRSGGHIPEAFLQGIGADDTFIDYMNALTTKPIEYYTCFISFDKQDQDFAYRLHTDLQANHVPCWFSPEDMKTGDQIKQRTNDSIQIYDKLLLILSSDSIISPWIEREVEIALDKEKRRKQPGLFPITIDDMIERATTPWASDIRRTLRIGDFTHWKDYDAYQKALKRLLRDLKQEE